MFGPLSFEDEIKNNTPDESQVPCLLCEDSFNLDLCLPLFLQHLFGSHSLVIESPQHIENLPGYLKFWREKFQTVPFGEIVPSISIDATDAKYFVLSTLNKTDKEVRHKLRLEKMLEVQEMERTDETYRRMCLFCKFNFEGKRADYLNHLSNEHNLRLGIPANLVYTSELVDCLSAKMDALQCIYCEKTFTDRTVLKEHMRKKQHKSINPNNRAYDKFYAVNYLDPDRNWHAIEKEHDFQTASNPNSEEEYGDWNESDSPIVCLFCAFKETDVNKLCGHMNSEHRFSFYALTRHLDFYQRIKLVNYIRHRIHNLRCPCCDEQFASRNELNVHMGEEEHCRLPGETEKFDQPEFYFPTYEDDALLYYLEEIED